MIIQLVVFIVYYTVISRSCVREMGRDAAYNSIRYVLLAIYSDRMLVKSQTSDIVVKIEGPLSAGPETCPHV